MQLQVLAWVVGLGCLALLAIAFLKGLYALASTATPAGLEAAFMKPIGSLITHLYAIPATHAPEITRWIWNLSPELHLREALFSMGHLGFLSTYAVMLLSIWIRARSARTIQAIDERHQRLKEIEWDESVRQRIRAQSFPEITSPPVSNDPPMPPDTTPKTPWHQTLLGIIVLGIALPVVADLIKILIGMTKWP